METRGIGYGRARNKSHRKGRSEAEQKDSILADDAWKPFLDSYFKRNPKGGHIHTWLKWSMWASHQGNLILECQPTLPLQKGSMREIKAVYLKNPPLYSPLSCNGNSAPFPKAVSRACWFSSVRLQRQQQPIFIYLLNYRKCIIVSKFT